MQDTALDLSRPTEGETVSLAHDVRQLAAEAKALAQAEVAFQKSRAAYVGSESKSIILLLVVAAVVLFFAIMALVVGVVIALGPVLGLWWAAAAVTLTLLAIALICAIIARARLRRMMAIAGGKS